MVGRRGAQGPLWNPLRPQKGWGGMQEGGDAKCQAHVSIWDATVTDTGKVLPDKELTFWLEKTDNKYMG